MIALLGQTRSPARISALQARGIGEMFTAGQDIWPPRRRPEAIDCGTFGPWRNGRPWNPAPFRDVLRKIREEGRTPLFVVAPDLIAQGVASLRFSLSWLPELQGLPVMLAVQDGMHVRQVARALHLFAGILDRKGAVPRG